MHVRAQIRHAVVKSLINATTQAGKRVYASRMKTLQPTDFPAICVYALSERSEVASKDGEMDRTLNLMADAYAEARGESIDDALDDMAAEIEAALLADGACAPGRFVELQETRIEINKGEDRAERPVGIARLRFSITYGTAAGTAETSN